MHLTSSRKILFVNPGLAMGGAEHSLLLLMRELKRRGHRPVVAAFGVGPFAKALSELELPTWFLDLPPEIRASGRYATDLGKLHLARLTARAIPGAAQLADIAKRENVDLIHTNGMKAHFLGGVAGRLARRPVIWHVRDFPPQGAAGRLFRTALRTLPRAVIANSRATATAIRADWRKAKRPRIVPIYNPVDLERFKTGRRENAVREALGLYHTDRLIGMVAHLTPWKGHEIFLRAAAIVSRSMYRNVARFLIAGGPIYETSGHEGYEERLHALARELGIADKVFFLGARDDVPQILHALDLLVHPPTAPEPFGRIIPEAQACGIPILATRIGALPEILDHMTTGYLVEPGSVEALADGILWMLKESPFTNMQIGYGLMVAKDFSPKNHAEQVLEVYDSVADR